MDGAWWTDAPCAGDLRFAPPEAEQAAAFLRSPLARQLLATCQDCPFRSACISRVLPRKSGFDGICGGRLWIDGQVQAECADADPGELAEHGSYIPHGTESGARAHNRRGEPACAWCREAGRRAQADRRARRRAARPDPSSPTH
ncbi:hypothetical protein K7472_08130 [Streptomyces sp. PTM05]|uniref:4Fe-4S Wbl-type domain-containing protein n=1 Tax=Streptantibioticus parmotrematis TaxID=2873249 RepID=A0ABS7QNR0_9ACTN|nr:hypothetical protein [Streptantibioticus parmotrematis]MBY8884813.1 hypothetical protein [Streptantibioticus parmotrematis]